jgi:hypothetical protein
VLDDAVPLTLAVATELWLAPVLHDAVPLTLAVATELWLAPVLDDAVPLTLAVATELWLAPVLDDAVPLTLAVATELWLAPVLDDAVPLLLTVVLGPRITSLLGDPAELRLGCADVDAVIVAKGMAVPLGERVAKVVCVAMVEGELEGSIIAGTIQHENREKSMVQGPSNSKGDRPGPTRTQSPSPLGWSGAHSAGMPRNVRKVPRSSLPPYHRYGLVLVSSRDLLIRPMNTEESGFSVSAS